ERELGEIGGRRQCKADVIYGAACIHEADDQRLFDGIRVGTKVVAGDDMRPDPMLMEECAEATPNGSHTVKVQLLSEEPARVILAEAGRLDEGEALIVDRIRRYR